MFFPKVVLKMASSNGFADFKMVKNVNGGGKSSYRRKWQQKTKALCVSVWL